MRESRLLVLVVDVADLLFDTICHRKTVQRFESSEGICYSEATICSVSSLNAWQLKSTPSSHERSLKTLFSKQGATGLFLLL